MTRLPLQCAIYAHRRDRLSTVLSPEATKKARSPWSGLAERDVLGLGRDAELRVAREELDADADEFTPQALTRRRARGWLEFSRDGAAGLPRDDRLAALGPRVDPRDQGPNRVRQCLLGEAPSSGSTLVLDVHLVAHLVGVPERRLPRSAYAEESRALDQLVKPGRLAGRKRLRHELRLPGDSGKTASTNDRDLQRDRGRARVLTPGRRPPPTPVAPLVPRSRPLRRGRRPPRSWHRPPRETRTSAGDVASASGTRSGREPPTRSRRSRSRRGRR